MRIKPSFRFCDRYLGIPLIFVLSLFFRKKRTFQSPQNIALLCTAAIGDTILISGIIADLQKQYPGAVMTFFVGSSNYETACLIPGIEVIKIPVTKPFSALAFIRKKIFDLWIDCGQWARVNALFSYFAKSHFKVGFQTPGQYRHFLYDLAVEHLPIHELENFRNLLRNLKVPSYHSPTFQVPYPDTQKPHQVVIHMFAGGSHPELRQWPSENWVEFMNLLIDSGYSVVLTGTAEDRSFCEKIRNSCRYPQQIEIIAGEKNISEIAKILLESGACISINTGIMHLAASLGCLTIALHGPTSPARWGPVGSHTHLVLPPGIKGPFLHLGFEKVPSYMEFISVAQVWEVFKTAYANRWTNQKPLVNL